MIVIFEYIKMNESLIKVKNWYNTTVIILLHKFLRKKNLYKKELVKKNVLKLFYVDWMICEKHNF